MDNVTAAAKKIAEDAARAAGTGLSIGLFVGAIAFIYTLTSNSSK